MSVFLPVVFFLAVCVLPGVALTRRIHDLPTDAMLRTALIGGLGLSTALVVTLLGFWAGLPVNQLAWALAAVSLAALPFCVWPRSASSPVSDNRMLVVGVAAVLAFCGWYQGGPFTIGGDGPELVAALKEILAGGRYFPTDTHFLSAGLAGVDIRKGLLHPLYATVFQVAPAGVLPVWRIWPMVFAPFPFLCAYAAVRLMGMRRGPSFLAGLLVVLTLNGGLTKEFAPLASNPKVVATCLFWLACGLQLHVLRRPSPAGYILAGMVATAAGVAHPMQVVFLAAFYASVLLWALVRRSGRAALGWSLAVALVGLAPYFVRRYAGYDPQNPLHLELQGMLFLDGLRVYSPMVWLESAGWLAIPGYAIFLLAKWRRWRRPADWWGWCAILGMLLPAFVPWLVPLAHRFLTYLVFRLPWMFPAAFAVPMALADLGPSKKRMAALVACGLFFLPTLFPLVSGRLLPRSSASSHDMAGEAEAFAVLDEVLPPRSVIVADPTTSYLIPALTGQKVMCNFDQHGTPNDGRALERITRAREILSPGLSPASAWRKAAAENADYVLLWKKTAPVLSLYWQPDATATSTRIRQLEQSPWFRSIPAGPDFALFQRVGSPPPADTDSLSMRETKTGFPARPPLIQGYGLRAWARGDSAAHVAPGDTLWVTFFWAKTPDYRPAPLRLAVRLTALDLPGGNRLGGKLWRKALEWLRSEEYQTRAGIPPGGGEAPPSIWPDREPVRQAVPVVAPTVLRPGAYALEAALLRMPAIPNYHLRDLFMNRDVFSGAPFDTVWIDPSGVH